MSQRAMNATDYLATMTEAQFQGQVERLADTFKWKWFHPPDDEAMKKTRGGWPDLVLTRDGLLIFAELKKQTEKPSPSQELWLAELARVAGLAGNVIVRVWRPSDLPGLAKLLKTGWRIPVSEGSTMRD